MSRLLSFALFFTLMLTVVGAVHYYIWARLVRDLALPVAWERTLTSLLVVLFLLIPASFFVLDISADSRDWVNVAYARYFGLARVRSMPPDGSPHVRN